MAIETTNSIKIVPQFDVLCLTQGRIVYKMPYRRARLAKATCATKGTLHTREVLNHATKNIVVLLLFSHNSEPQIKTN